MIEEFLRGDEKLRLTVLIVDARHEPTELDRVTREWLLECGVAHQIVATKADKLSSNKLRHSLHRIEQSLSINNVLPYSAATGMGRKELWQIIKISSGEILNHG